MEEAPVILIVDDDASVRAAIASLVESAGFESETFASAEEFLSSGPGPDCTCLILDVKMPGMNGLELQRRLLAHNLQIPIIFISAHADAEVRARALQAGAIAFFHKPFGSAALLEAIDRAIDRAQASRGEDAGQ